MPNSLLAADTLFPQIDENKTQNENLRTVTNYLYMLVEELRYTFNNLDIDNFNDAGLEELAKIITEPVYVQLKDDEGNISALMVQANSLFSRMQSAEGNISTLQQTATALSSRVQSTEGNISTLTQTADAIILSVSNLATDFTTLSLTVNGLTIEGPGGTTLINGAMIKTGTIYGDAIIAGTINGSAIQAGTVTANYLIGDTVGLRSQVSGSTYTAGAMTITGSSSSTFAVELGSNGALRLTADDGAVYLYSRVENDYGAVLGTAFLQISYSTTLSMMAITCGADTVPSSSDRNLGNSSLRWNNVYCVTCDQTVSDRQKKKDISYVMDNYEGLFDELRPTPYKFIDGTSGRTHVGFISQDIEDSLTEHGLTALDFAGFCKDPKRDDSGQIIEGEYDYALRYEEFIALNTWQIQKLKERVKALEDRV